MSSLRTFKYRKRSPLGGLAADLSASSATGVAPPAGGVRIHKDFWISLPSDGMYWLDLAWLTFGASICGEKISQLEVTGVCVSIHDLRFPLSDYRPEVAALAMEGWLREEFQLGDSDVSVEFGEVEQDYAFHWGGARPFFERW